MFPFLAPYLEPVWGPFRLLGSYLVLIGIGTALAALLNWALLPRLAQRLPRDGGRPNTHDPAAALGKPTGAGFLVVLILLPVLFLVLPMAPRVWGVVFCLVIAMVTGYLDDCSERPWGEVRKGMLDLAVALLTGLVLCGGHAVDVWLPLVSGSFACPPWLYVPCAAALLWFTINATNCSDGVDGLAGSLTLLSLFYLGGFLYLVVGHTDMADYLLVPHYPDGARWALLVITAAGGFAGYLWHNAEPSRMLMGDAGSRFLGLLIGVAVLVAGNPFLILVAAPVILANGGAGLVKLLRAFRRLGFDVTPPAARTGAAGADGTTPGPQHVLVRLLHRVRFPLHDHCRRNLRWSNAQVLLRFMLIQAFLTPLLLLLLIKIR
jgi:phospho-N-acetylmuramoyl-pentapeptide-transferase